MSTYIHPTAIIYPNVTIGDGCYIGPYCIIGAPAEHPNVDPLNPPSHGVYIGDNCRLHGFNTVDAGMERTTFIENECVLMKGAHVGHDAIVHMNVTISCGARIGGHSFVSAFCNIGLNAVLHQFTALNNGIMVGASAFVKGEWGKPWRILAGVPAKDIGPNTVGLERFNNQHRIGYNDSRPCDGRS